MNYAAIFFTGLTSGGLTCLAMQGGLLASVIANQHDKELEQITRKTSGINQTNILPVSLFLAAKLISHTLLGFLLGWLGSKMELSLSLRLLFQTLAALFMLATAANLLELHPIFRYVVIQPPKFLTRLVRNSSKGSAFFTPALLGLLTVFVPCGITQAMEVLAISSGNPFVGALILFFFVLGTSPLFTIVGVLTAQFSQTYQQKFLKVAAGALIILGLTSINGVLVVLDSPFTFGKLSEPIVHVFLPEQSTPTTLAETDKNRVQKVLISVQNNGYSPKVVKVKAGIPVELTLETNNIYSCASSFRLKAFNISMQLAATDRKSATFTPTQKGKFPFSCSMGMYTGTLEVI